MSDENAPDRRAVLRSAAWAVPVVAVAVAAPAAAASLQRLTWTWTASYITSRQADVTFTVFNPTDAPVDVVFQAPRQQGAVEAYGYGFGSWNVSIVGSMIVCMTTVPAHSSSSTPWIGYFTRTPPASEVLVGTVSPAATPATATVSLTFT